MLIVGAYDTKTDDCASTAEKEAIFRVHAECSESQAKLERDDTARKMMRAAIDKSPNLKRITIIEDFCSIGVPSFFREFHCQTPTRILIDEDDVGDLSPIVRRAAAGTPVHIESLDEVPREGQFSETHIRRMIEKARENKNVKVGPSDGLLAV